MTGKGSRVEQAVRQAEAAVAIGATRFHRLAGSFVRPAARSIPPPPPTGIVREALDELGYYITEAGTVADVAEDFPGWLLANLDNYAAVTITENSRRVAAVTIDDDEGLTIYLFGNAGVLLTSPINCQADAMGTVCFLAVAAEIARF